MFWYAHPANMRLNLEKFFACATPERVGPARMHSSSRKFCLITDASALHWMRRISGFGSDLSERLNGIFRFESARKYQAYIRRTHPQGRLLWPWWCPESFFWNERSSSNPGSIWFSLCVVLLRVRHRFQHRLHELQNHFSFRKGAHLAVRIADWVSNSETTNSVDFVTARTITRRN